MNTTVITALYNIDREHKGDKRKWSDYLEWFKNTLKLPLPMVIFIDISLKDYVEEHRPALYRTKIVIQDIPYANLELPIKRLITSDKYKQRMKDPNRVECILPFYNIIQYSKFKWLKHAIEKNYFDSDYFFWMDAGISRFINVNVPVKEHITLLEKKLYIQKNDFYDMYPVNFNYLWDSQCLLCGTMFGGDSYVLLEMEKIVDKLLHDFMHMHQWINNEQILLAFIAKEINPSLFNLILNDTSEHISLFQKLFIS
jgi:hypothetical protein